MLGVLIVAGLAGGRPPFDRVDRFAAALTCPASDCTEEMTGRSGPDDMTALATAAAVRGGLPAFFAGWGVAGACVTAAGRVTPGSVEVFLTRFGSPVGTGLLRVSSE